MATSGTYTYTVTRDDIIRQALLNIGKLDSAETPEPGVTTDCARLLNMLCKQWMGRADFAPGLKVWTQKRGHLFLKGGTNKYSVGPTATGWTEEYTQTTVVTGVTAGVSVLTVVGTTYTAGQKVGVQLDTEDLQWTTISSVSVSSGNSTLNLAAALTQAVSAGAWVYIYTTTAQQPLSIEAAVLRNENLNDMPLAIMTQKTYDALPGKAAPESSLGDPMAIYYEFQLGNSNLYTDVAAANDMRHHIVLTYFEPIQNFDNPTDNPHYPAEYFLALTWGLSKQIAPMFHAVWTPTMEDNYQQATAVARHKDAERVDAYFQPYADDE